MAGNLIADRLASAALNLLYPSRCPVCGEPSDAFSHAPICRLCWQQVRKYRGPSCSVCARPLESEYAGLCGECLRSRPPFSVLLAYGLYSGPLREAINQLKFMSARRLAGPLGGLLSELDIPRANFIVPVPLSRCALRERGFNQTALISRSLSRATGVPVSLGLLYKKKETPTQIGLSGRQRRLNLKGAFGLRKRLAGQRVLLLDDVVTTGATARECAKTLLEGGAGEVIATALARA
jgi:ComF family protein